MDIPTLNLLELLGVITGIVNVWLTARANVWCWPVGIINAIVYFVVFFEAKLYADMLLQAVYLVLTCYGWYEWLRGGTEQTGREISPAPKRELLVALAFGAIAWVVIWLIIWLIVPTLTIVVIRLVLHTLTDASLPYTLTDASLPLADSFLTAASLVGTWLMARKYIENWMVWIIADTLYVGMFLYKHLFPTAILYAVFTVLAVYGLITWRKENYNGIS